MYRSLNVPTYVFRCEDCQTVFERFISFADMANQPRILCPQCASQRLQRVRTAPLVLAAHERSTAGGNGGSGCACGTCN